MVKKHVCPNCGGRDFYTTAHVMQEWLVHDDGEFVAVSTDCLEVTHGPDDDNIWTCVKCGAEAVVEEAAT